MRLRLNVRLAENLVESIRLLDSQEADSKNEEQSKHAHNDAPYTHGEKEKGNKKVNHVSATESEQRGSNGRVLKSGYQWRWRFYRDTKHDQADKSDQNPAQNVKVMGPHCEVNRDGNIQLQEHGTEQGSDTKQQTSGVRHNLQQPTSPPPKAYS